jgi:CDP-diacylglycerol--glycerol-3-phosphate 3-phosphatidyltransferase
MPLRDAPPGTVFLVAVFAAAIGSMVVYGFLGKKRDGDADGKGAQLFLGLGDFLLHWFLWAIDPAVRVSIRLGLTPDFYNYAGLLLGVLSGVFIAVGQLPLGGWAIALGGICDILDGRIARATGVASDYGDFIDSTFDRFVEVFTFLGFVVLLRDSPYGPFLASAAMAGSLLVSYARARGEVLGVNCSGGLMQRGERLLLACLACLLDPLLASLLGWSVGTLTQWMLALVAVTTFVTAVHRVVWIAGRLRAVANGGSTPQNATKGPTPPGVLRPSMDVKTVRP